MRNLASLALAAGVVLGASGTLEAQYQAMPGATIGTPMGYSYGYPNYSSYGYGRAAVAPRSYSHSYPYYAPYRYSTAYLGPVAAPYFQSRPVNPYGYVNRPYYGAFGYGNYSNGSTDGFPPFRSLRGR